jgi:hypothetical protein
MLCGLASDLATVVLLEDPHLESTSEAATKTDNVSTFFIFLIFDA